MPPVYSTDSVHTQSVPNVYKVSILYSYIIFTYFAYKPNFPPIRTAYNSVPVFILMTTWSVGYSIGPTPGNTPCTHSPADWHLIVMACRLMTAFKKKKNLF